jgi:hypothetical protein
MDLLEEADIPEPSAAEDDELDGVDLDSIDVTTNDADEVEEHDEL